jgi:hypothetical protein
VQTRIVERAPDISWDEVDRAEAAVAVWALRWGLVLNPEDCEATAVSAVTAARSSWSRDEIYTVTEDYITDHELRIGRRPSAVMSNSVGGMTWVPNAERNSQWMQIVCLTEQSLFT